MSPEADPLATPEQRAAAFRKQEQDALEANKKEAERTASKDPAPGPDYKEVIGVQPDAEAIPDGGRAAKALEEENEAAEREKAIAERDAEEETEAEEKK